MKDTAVKFLIDEISCRFIISEELRIAMYKAIEMEKEQIIDAYETAMETDIYNEPLKTGKQYYEENCKPEII
jgi:hypothetical protein